MLKAKTIISLLLIGAGIAGCAKASAIQTARNQLHITADAAQICGSSGAQEVAAKRAAIETIRRGYDSYIIYSGNQSSAVNFYGQNLARSYQQGFSVTMFRHGESGSENAISARDVLGPDWQSKVSSNSMTCLG